MLHFLAVLPSTVISTSSPSNLYSNLYLLFNFFDLYSLLDTASHFYSSTSHPLCLRNPQAESSKRAFQKDLSNSPIGRLPVYSESTMYAGPSCIKFNNLFNPRIAFSPQSNSPPSPVNPLQSNLPVEYRRRL